MLKFTLFAAAAITLAGAPAFAAEPAAAGVEGAKVADVAPATPKVDNKRYCVLSEVTGSRIPQKECHTRKEWIETTGQDPLAKN